MTCMCVEYPALIYKNNKNNLFIANCLIKNLVGMGKTEIEHEVQKERDSLA